MTRQEGSGNELLGRLIQANKRPVRIVRPRINIEHLFHRRYECAARLRRDDPLFLAVRLKRVFLRTRPMVLSVARSTMPNSTTLSSKSRSVQRAWPSGGAEQASAVSRASFSPSKRGVIAGSRAACGSAPPQGRPPRTAGEPASPWTCWCRAPRRSGHRSNPPLRASIGLEQDPGFQ